MLRTFIREQLGSPSFNLLFSTEEEARSWIDQYKASIHEEGDQEIAERITITPQPQASCVIIDQTTGCQSDRGRTRHKRSQSDFKPCHFLTKTAWIYLQILTAYAPALDLYGKTLASVYNNAPYINKDGNPITNWDVNSYTGPTAIRSTIHEMALNIK